MRVSSLPISAKKEAAPGMGRFEWGCGKVPRVVGGRHPSHRGKKDPVSVVGRLPPMAYTNPEPIIDTDDATRRTITVPSGKFILRASSYNSVKSLLV